MGQTREKLLQIGYDTRFSSTNQPKEKGRKKNRFKSVQMDFSFSQDDLKQLIIDVGSMTPDELKQLVNDRTVPAFKLAMAMTVIDAIKKGNITQVMYMFERLFGKPTEHREIKSEITMEVKEIKDYLEQKRIERLNRQNGS